MKYRQALTEAMTMLAEDKRVVFLGQGVEYPGTFMSTTLQGVPEEKRIELPVAEQMQAGMCIGMALAGLVPVCIYPRWNFALLAADMLVNHIDKMQPHLIIRVGVGSTKPLDPGPQHTGDMTDAFRLLMPNTAIIRLESPDEIVEGYGKALSRREPTVLVELADLYSS